MLIEKVSSSKLNPAAYNPRRDLKPGDKDYEKLKRSISEFGYVEPVIWNKTTGNVVGGHQRLKVLLDLGHTEIDCVVVELNEQREKALNLALNKIQGDWDETKLSTLMAEFDATTFDVSLTGFDADEVDALLNKFYSKDAVQDDFDVDKEKEAIEASGETRTRRDDIWLLGNHRLLCGDSTDEEDFAKLMNGVHAQCAVTSPPYGVGKEYEKVGIDPWFDTMRPAIKNICRYADIVCWNIGDLFATGSQFIEPTQMYSAQLFADNGFRPIWIRIWKKQGMNFGVGPYHLVTNKPVQQYSVTLNYAAYTACGAPTSCSVSSTLAEGNVTLSWSGAKSGTNNTISSYEIQYSESSNNSSWGSWAALTTVSTTSTSGSVSVSPPSTRGYYRRFQVRTRGTAGSSY